MNFASSQTVLFAGAALLALSVTPGVAGERHHAMTSAGTHARFHGAARHAGDRALSVLYDQTSNPSGLGIVSQNFGDQYDSAAADDFTVPKGSVWNVKEIDVPGAYFNGYGPADSEDVTVWKSGKKGPGGGKVVAQFLDQAGADDDGSFAVKLKGLKLKPGHYWVSFVVNMDFNPNGEWAWENQTAGTVEGDPAMWENPGDGYGSGCTDWTVETKCVLNPLGDHMFVLKGTSK